MAISCLFALGNPLLDVIVRCDSALLEKYKLKQDAAIEVDDWQMAIFDDILQFERKYAPGGSALNTCRILRALLRDYTDLEIVFAGCIGNDENGKRLAKMVDEDKVQTLYMFTDSHPTGISADLISGSFRSMCANIGAAQQFSINHLQQPEISVKISQSTIVYVEGYFITHSFDSAIHSAETAKHNGQLFALNLSADYICRNFKDRMETIAPYTNFIFGNNVEAAEFYADSPSNCTTSSQFSGIKELAQAVWTKAYSRLETKPGIAKKNDCKEASGVVPSGIGTNQFFDQTTRCVIVTQDCLPVVAYNGKDVFECPVPRVPASDIVDTVGAGDSFVSGFFAGLILGKDLQGCVTEGINTAARVIQKAGCQI